MTACNFRSLLLAAIVLSNCITWTASRHHYTHNVRQHRTRHRRQGAGLYLSATYVIPGGEGQGAWGEWGEVSPCSRTCGGGVASQKRICLQLGSDGQPECTGGDTKYFSCQTQDCPAGSIDFRAQQCSEFDDELFRGYKYNWVPYTKAPNPCQLNCMPHGERFYYQHKPKVIDGTRCNDESFDVCVNGTCQHVGCDMMLGSKAHEDKCRECRGTGASCHTTSGLFDSQDLMKGYNDILLIPQGSTSIVIEEVKPSNNYLALRAKNGTYYLNGHYHIDFPRSMIIGGALWYYERSQGYEAPDKLRCLGPTTEPLYLSLLLQDENVGINYEYSVPNDSAPPADKRYNWVHEDFTPCSATCGGGFQTRNVTCRSREQLEVVKDNLCDEGLKPPTNQSCNLDPCPADWAVGEWGECSKRCGSDGVSSREVTCQKIIANGIASIVADDECFNRLGPKPELFQKCNQDAPCPTWFIGKWKPCDKLCDEGKQKRQIVCYQIKDGRKKVLDDKDCTDEKPAAEQPCYLQPCDGVDWITTKWTGCDTCDSKVRTRGVMCATKGREVLNDSFCAYHTRPVNQEPCTETKPCEVQWYASHWSKCSVLCGSGVKTRRVFCGQYNEKSVTVVDDTKCAHLPKYNDTKPCTVPKEECPAQWFSGKWTECTKKCGGGERYRKVMCFLGDLEVEHCDGDFIPEGTEYCNTGPCNEDEMLPVDSKSTPIMDGDECDYDSDYPEVGLDADTTSLTSMDLMFSDSPGSGYAELESTMAETGSGFGTLTTDDISIIEGSGFTGITSDSSVTEDTDYTSEEDSTTTQKSTTIDKDKTSKTTALITTPEAGSGTKPTVTEDTDTSPTVETDTTEDTTSSDTSATHSTEPSVTEDTVTTPSSSEADTEGTESTPSDTTDVTDTTSSDTSTDGSLSTDTKESSTTESSASSTSSSDDTTLTSDTDSTESEETSDSTIETSTVSGGTDLTESTGTDDTSTTGSTVSTVTDNTSPTESTVTEGTESTVTEATESTVTEATESTATETTESTVTESTITSSTDTEDTFSTESTEATGSTPTADSESTGTNDSTLTTDETTAESTSDSSLSTKKDSDETTKTTAVITTKNTATTVSGITEASGTTEVSAESTSTSSGSESTTESGSTLSSSAGSESSTAELSTTESGSTIKSSSSGSSKTTEQSSTVSTGSSTESSKSTGLPPTPEPSTTTIESSTTVGTESTTVELASTTDGSITVGSTTEGSTSGSDATGSTEESSTTESGSTEESTEGSTTSIDSSTEVSGSTTEGVSGSSTEGISTTEGTTTTEYSVLSTSTTPRVFPGAPARKPICPPRRKQKCEKSQFGCCPDKKTAAAGPFDDGCPKPRTCKEAMYGCCPDGLSPAQGENYEGCPIEACADTLFGCCQSDNKTAAQGNDQDGCPPPPPACLASTYGCCADNETEASGPDSKGCPEFETTTVTDIDTTGTTEYYETSEASSTPSDGTTDVTATSAAPTCESSTFGCCSDNLTEASGPDGQGCHCNATEFGCCPDHVTPAQGVDNEGCPGPCSTSEHGCCQDGKTPAHGPDFEGCCLLQAFGCCPDNRKPAEGLQLKGCGCQYARYGCCPDNVTIALGSDNQGCGCLYAEHGCCPDRHTAASGPNNEGCGCNTYQFGCCPDGVTTAKGPDQQGCNCRDSKYGCCGDAETPATGPNFEGCDCSSSQHGCCPDGKTAASGPKFLGCTDAPENKQAVCSMSTDPGSCHNFTASWYYDLAYGGCSRFWYGGCEGNGNRFATKEECEDVCVQPAPKDACKLPSVKGPCDADYVRWHYNSSREQCIPFRYGGCLGNSNNFDSRELCQAQCEPDRTANQCSLPIEQGSCAGNYGRWGFNTETHRCEQFIWGGCEGNSNRFSTEAACIMRCDPPGTPKPQCSEPQDTGNCSEKEALWSFSQSENRCVPFYYSGCRGNSNRFTSREACEQTCPSAYVPDKCTLPAETGDCSNYREKWFFDTGIKRCRQFYYGGCNGNENRFDTLSECQSNCFELTITTTTIRPTEPQPQQPTPQPEPQPEPERPDFCFLAVDAGPCTDMKTRYAYDSELGRCRTFEYGGCGGNRNNFPNELYCTHYCHPIQDVCQLPMLSGPCEDSQMRWFYDPASDSCSQFTYGGCEGNDNRFESRDACERRCRTGPAQNTPRTTVTTVAPTTPLIDVRLSDVPEECKISGTLEECLQVAAGEVWYLDPSSHECVAHVNPERGAACRNTGAFTSLEACERSCGAFRGVDVCQQRLDAGPCSSFVTKVYFDTATKQCREFEYGGCLGGANRFSSVQECSQVCNVQIDPCTLPPDEGNCQSYSVVERWYFDPTRGQCYQFGYSGCSGNENRFDTQQDCEARCKPAAAVTTTLAPAVVPPQKGEEECVTPSSLMPCGENVTVFYYDSERRACLASGFGGCEHPNSYSTEEECERRCGAFRGVDACGARLDPGPCRASIPKFYWDSVSGSCQGYAFGGCGGGPNRFSTYDECERVCGAAGPVRKCLQDVDTGVRCAGAGQSRRYHYSVTHRDCVVFLYQGCGGNDNNFHSYEQCVGVCKHHRPTGDDYNQVAVRDCELMRQECDALVCPYGIERVEQNGCQRCRCKEDPCVRADCSATERCVAVAVRDSRTQEALYSARCVANPEANEVLPDCEAYIRECDSLQCEYGVQHMRTADGCERCTCVTTETKCQVLEDECKLLVCNYGKETTTGTDGCNRCKCKEHPCSNKQCAEGERCVVTAYRDAVDWENKYSADCRLISKPGMCPMDDTTTNDVSCRRHCTDDADCRGVGKCCQRGCGTMCLAPAESTTPGSPALPLFTTTHAPDVPSAPQVIPQAEPNVAASEGGTATLRCLFHGNPPPKITWRRGELTIDGSVGRYRLTSDGALEIVSLYRNDTGVYICVADNGLGVARQEIQLVVSDPVRVPVGIAGDENAVVTGELGRPLLVRCLAYGYPQPSVFWYRGFDGNMVPYNDAVYEARGNVLLIRSLAIETLGEYTCQAYNGEGKAASWLVAVQAYMPEGVLVEHEYLVPRVGLAHLAHTQPPTTRDTTTPTTTTTTEAPIPMFTVPVSTHLSAPQTTLNIGADLRLACEVDGFPDPEVQWTKDGATIQNDGRISITGSMVVSRLAVLRVTAADSGIYACHASNPYSSHSDTVQINVQQLLVPAKCTDNPFFANCDLIVRSKFCRHKYYSKFCCKSCVEAGQLDPQEAELQADQPFRRK